MGMNMNELVERMYEMAMSCAQDTGEDLIESLGAWGFDSKIVAEGDSWLLFIEDAFVTSASADNPVDAMDLLYNRVIELFVSHVITA